MKRCILNGFLLPIFLMLPSFTAHAEAVKLPGNIIFHIAKTHYEHPIRLLHPYLDIWHMKGPLAEKVVRKSLEKRFANVNDCNGNGSVVLLLEPHMFYNPQLRVFHGEFIARVYTSDGEPITTIKKQAEQHGEIAVKPDFYMEKAYSKAMTKIIKNLEIDKAFLATLDKPNLGNSSQICQTLDDLPVAKIYY